MNRKYTQNLQRAHHHETHVARAHVAGISQRPLELKLALPGAGIFGVLKAPVEVGLEYTLSADEEFKFNRYYDKHVGLLDPTHHYAYPTIDFKAPDFDHDLIVTDGMRMNHVYARTP